MNAVNSVLPRLLAVVSSLKFTANDCRLLLQRRVSVLISCFKSKFIKLVDHVKSANKYIKKITACSGLLYRRNYLPSADIR